MTSCVEDLICEVVLILMALTVGWRTYLFFTLTYKLLDQELWEKPSEVNLEIENNMRNNKEE